MPRGKTNKLAVRTAYVVKRWSAKKCAEEFGVHETTVKTWASAEGWTVERDRIATNATAAATHEATAIVAAAGVELRAKHQQILVGLHALLEGSAEDVAASKVGRGRAETRRACLESFQIAAKLGRLALGLTEGQSSVTEGEDDGKKRIIFTIADEESA